MYSSHPWKNCSATSTVRYLQKSMSISTTYTLTVQNSKQMRININGVWKKATEKSRYRFSAKITALFEEINVELTPSGIAIPTNTEYVPEYLTEVLKQYTAFWKLDEADFVHGRGHHKSPQQRHYERLQEYTNKLKEYNPYRAVNFHIDETGTLRCPNGRAFRFFYRQHVRGNHFGRQEEVYQCEDCTGCPYAPDCKRTDETGTGPSG